MDVYIEHKNGIPDGYEMQAAYFGAIELGYNIVPFESKDIISLKEYYSSNVFVGYTNTMKTIFSSFGKSIDIPNPGHLKEGCVNDLYNLTFPLFAKSIEVKTLSGTVFTRIEELSELSLDPNLKVYYTTEIFDIESEYRC